MAIKLGIAGAGGRMGRALIETALQEVDFSLCGASEVATSKEIGQDLGTLVNGDPIGVEVSKDIADAIVNAEVWVDFTVPMATLTALSRLVTSGAKATIIGTTGFDAAQEEQVAKASEKLAIVKAGNFSLGVNLATALIEQASAKLGPDFDIEIGEAHHKHKIDAPSGTALMFGEAAATGRGAPLKELQTSPYDGITGPRKKGTIGFNVKRAGAIVGEHEALFAGEKEHVIITHRAFDRSLFAEGALYAAKWAVNQPPGLYTMRDCLGI